MCVCKEREKDFKVSVHTTVEAGKSEICRIGEQARADVVIQVQSQSAGRVPFSSGEITF